MQWFNRENERVGEIVSRIERFSIPECIVSLTTRVFLQQLFQCGFT